MVPNYAKRLIYSQTNSQENQVSFLSLIFKPRKYRGIEFIIWDVTKWFEEESLGTNWLEYQSINPLKTNFPNM